MAARSRSSATERITASSAFLTWPSKRSPIWRRAWTTIAVPHGPRTAANSPSSAGPAHRSASKERGGTRGAQPGRGRRGGQQPPAAPAPAQNRGTPTRAPGLTQGTSPVRFDARLLRRRCGHRPGAARFWHNAPDERTFTNINNIQCGWRRGAVQPPDRGVAPLLHRARRGRAKGAHPAAYCDGLVENISLTSDGKYLYFCTNATDIDRRHHLARPPTGVRPGGAGDVGPRHRMQPGGPGVRQGSRPVFRRAPSIPSPWRSCRYEGQAACHFP